MKNMKMKIVIFCLVGSLVFTQRVTAQSWFFENATKKRVYVVVTEKFIRQDVQKYAAWIQPGEYGFWDSGVASRNLIEVKNGNTDNAKVIGIANGNFKARGWKIIPDTTNDKNVIVKEDNWVSRGKNTFRVVNKTDIGFGVNVMMSAGCKDKLVGVPAGGSGKVSCTSMLEGPKKIIFNGAVYKNNKWTTVNLSKVLPWNAKGGTGVASDAVFFVRKMTETEKKFYGSLFPAYKDAEYRIELHEKGI